MSVADQFVTRWGQREARGDVNIDSFDKNWMEAVCEVGLGLHVVLNAGGLPPWVDAATAAQLSEWFILHD